LFDIVDIANTISFKITSVVLLNTFLVNSSKGNLK